MSHGLPIHVMRIAKALLEEGGPDFRAQFKMVGENAHRGPDQAMSNTVVNHHRLVGLSDRKVCRFYNVSENGHDAIVKIWVGLDDRP